MRGAGGGGKSGGGSVRTPTESPNTLRSKQVARVMLLAGEGEWEGLVNGFQSIYLDGTPVQNPDGTYNFKNVSAAIRKGIQGQSIMTGFSFTETEVPVGVEVVKATPIVRTITDTETDAARVTVSVPALTFQSTTTGDLGGTQVEIKIEVQNDGGGYVAVPLRVIHDRSKFTTDKKMTVASDQVMVDVKWTGNNPGLQERFGGNIVTDTSTQNASFRLERRPVSGGSWTTVKDISFSGAAKIVYVKTGFITSTPQSQAPTSIQTIQVDMPNGTYEFQVTKLSGAGTAAIDGAAVALPDPTGVIDGKTVTRYQRGYEFDLPAPGPWDIKVTRITADSTISNLQNKTYWDSYTQIIDDKLSYPNSVLLGLKIDAEQFSTIPVVAGDWKMLRVKVPSNYDPITRIYTGTWNGTFKTAWTDNPAWCFYDMLTTGRYGLGEYIPAAAVDKWSLYTIAQYCDEMVDDGKGGQEPRFTCNLYLQEQEEAYNVIAAMASVFRGITYWSAGSIQCQQDAPSDTVALFAHANVIDGEFNYSGSSAKVRHTVALVSYNDPETSDLIIEYVEDREGIAKFGQIETQVVAIGCNSRGQAHRFGRALLYSERLLTETTSFRIGMEGAYLYPGAIIETADRNRLGVEYGGRLTAATGTTVTLDRSVSLSGGEMISCVMPDGTVEKVSVTPNSGNTVNANFTQTPIPNAIWLIESGTIAPKKWRVISLAENEGVLDVAALEHSELKYDSIEGDLFLEEPEGTRIGATAPTTPYNKKITESLYLAGPGVVNNRGTVSWANSSERYLFEWRDPSGQWHRVETGENSHDIDPMPAGEYTIGITAVNKLGRKSAKNVFTYTALGKLAPPGNVQNFRFAYVNGQALLTYDRATDLDVLISGRIEIRHSALSSTWDSAMKIAEAPGSSTSLQTFARAGYYIAKWIDSSGKQSTAATIIQTGVNFEIDQNVIVTQDLLAIEDTSDGFTLSGGELKNSSISLFDDYVEYIDNIGMWDQWDGVVTSGWYQTDPVDLLGVLTSTVAVNLAVSFTRFDDLFDSRNGYIDDWEDFDGELLEAGSVTVLVSTTNDDPAGSPTWSDWAPFFTGTYTARAYRFRIEFTVDEGVIVTITDADVAIDVPDKIQSGDNITSLTSVQNITYTDPFYVKPALAITAQDMATGDYYTISSATKTGFGIIFRNSAGTAVVRTYDFIAKKY